WRRSVISTFATRASTVSSRFLMRSCVIGRAVGIFSSSSAIALASGSPTQIDNERLSSSSWSTIFGMCDSGSSTRFLTFISSHMVFLLLSHADQTNPNVGTTRVQCRGRIPRASRETGLAWLGQGPAEAVGQRLRDLHGHDGPE